MSKPSPIICGTDHLDVEIKPLCTREERHVTTTVSPHAIVTANPSKMQGCCCCRTGQPLDTQDRRTYAEEYIQALERNLRGLPKDVSTKRISYTKGDTAQLGIIYNGVNEVTDHLRSEITASIMAAHEKTVAELPAPAKPEPRVGRSRTSELGMAFPRS